MNFNWIDAATPQGMERLEELMDTGETVPCKWKSKRNEKIPVRFLFAVKKENRYYLGASESTNRVDESFVNGVEFLDPDPRLPIEALKAENERMRNALLDIEADARAKLAANLPLNSNETLHSVKHGLGQMFVNSKSGDIGSVIDAIARTFAKDDDFCA